MTNCREQILRGELFVPEQIVQIVNPSGNAEKRELIESFFQHIWYNFLLEKPVDSVLWFTKFNNKSLYNSLLMHLSKAGWITSTIDNEFAYVQLNESKLLKWVSPEELSNIRYFCKFEKYRLKKTSSNVFDMVQINGKHIKTGLIRKGFKKAGNNTFKYDTRFLKVYIDLIAKNVEKGLTNSTKDITYLEICNELLEYYAVDGTEYTLGRCIADSRGRSIYDCTHKIFNPISHKDARALLILPNPHPLDGEGFKAVYAAIAELNGYRGKDYDNKALNGQSMYLLREMPDITEMELKFDDNRWAYYEDLHKRIWLERIYENLDQYEEWGERWYVPIEIDATASALQFIGVLTNDYEYMRRTNLIMDSEGFLDPWTVDYTSRNNVKKAMTPQIYGSGKTTRELWDKNKLNYDQVQLNKMSEDMSVGRFANACRFKDFIINNVQPQAKMHVNIFGEKFYIECNRFKWEETTKIDYYIYTSQQGLLKKVTRRFNLTPDPKQFKRYFVTLLVHNLDSQVANEIAKELDWILPNHDSFTIHPNDVEKVRRIYMECMKTIHKNRKEILKAFFDSIGIDKDYPEREDKRTENIEFSPFCLK